MPTESFKKSGHVPAPPEQLWQAWLDGERHAEMTGSRATSTPEPGGAFTAWGGFITGTWVELVPGERVVMRWRTSAFPEDTPDSKVTLHFTPAEGGTTLSIQHSDIPEGQGADYLGGWDTHYFNPLRRFFGD